MKNELNKYLESNLNAAKKADHVKINKEKLFEFANKLNIENSIHWLNSLPYEISNLTIEDTISFLLIYHAIGFCYWGDPKWEIEYDGKKYDGAYGLIFAFSRQIKVNKNFFSFKYLGSLTFEEFEKILEGNIEIPLIRQRYNILIEVCKTVNEKMNSDFYNYVKNINKDIELLDVIVNNFSSFEDISIYKGEKVYIYKRAQLLVFDILHILQDKTNIEVDYTNLIGCADYKIPQVLRDLEITTYDSELSNLVDNQIVVEKGSNYEVEIRATMITVISEIKQLLKGKYSSMAINNYIWRQGQDKNNLKRPYHRTRTIAY